jgi:TonB family protein
MKFLLGAALGLLGAATPALRPAPTPERTFSLNYLYHEAAEGSAELGYRARRYRLAPEVVVDSVFSLDGRTLRRVLTMTRQPAGDTLTVTDTWRADGHRGRHEVQLGGKLHGLQRQYAADGRLCREISYDHGQRQDSSCFDAAGAAACVGRNFPVQLPEYPGGMNGLMQHLARNVRYPAAALRARAQGKVQVTFIIDETGQARDLRVAQGVTPELDAEALRVLQKMPRWLPGRLQDEPVPVLYTVPVTFRFR